MAKQKSKTKKKARPAERYYVYEMDKGRLLQSFPMSEPSNAFRFAHEAVPRVFAGAPVIVAWGAAQGPEQIGDGGDLDAAGLKYTVFNPPCPEADGPLPDGTVPALPAIVGWAPIRRTDSLYMLLSSGDWAKGDSHGTCGAGGKSLVVYVNNTRETYVVNLHEVVEQVAKARKA